MTVLCAVIVVAGGFSWKTYLLVHQESYSERFSAGVAHSVSIDRDEVGTPRIHAESFEDALFALGYCQAQDRLPVMEYYRAITKGDLRLIPKEDRGLLSRLVPSLGVSEAAAAAYEKLDDRHRVLMQSFANGINAYLHRHKDSFIIFRKKDRTAWTPQDVLSIAVLDGWADSFLSSGPLTFSIPEKKYFKALEDFIPGDAIFTYKERYAEFADTVLAVHRVVDHTFGARDGAVVASVPGKDGAKGLFAVAGFKASTVFPRSMNVLMDISGVTYSCISKAGSPFLTASLSSSLRYSAFPFHVDSVRLYLLPVDRKDGVVGYVVDSQWKKFEEPVLSRGVRMTDFGPVLSDLEKHDDVSVCVAVNDVRFSEKTITALLDGQWAKDVDDSVRAVSGYEGSPLCFVIRGGERTVIIPSGKVPARAKKSELFTERRLQSPSIDLSSLKRDLFSVHVFCASIPSVKDYPSIAEYIPCGSNLRLEEIAAIPENEFSEKRFTDAVRSLTSERDIRIADIFVKQLTDIPVTSAKLVKQYLSEWDGTLADSLKAPGIYNQMIRAFLTESLEDKLGKDMSLVLDNPSLYDITLETVLSQKDSRAFDNTRTPDAVETFDIVFGQSFIKAMRIMHRKYGPEMGEWSWAKMHASGFTIPYLHKNILSPEIDMSAVSGVPYSALVRAGVETGTFFARDYAVNSLVEGDSVSFYANCPASANPLSEFSGWRKDGMLSSSASFKEVRSMTIDPLSAPAAR